MSTQRLRRYSNLVPYLVMTFSFLFQFLNEIVNSFVDCHDRLLNCLMGYSSFTLARGFFWSEKFWWKTFNSYFEWATKEESLVREFESQPGALFLKVWVVASSEEFCLLFVALTSKSRYKLIWNTRDKSLWIRYGRRGRKMKDFWRTCRVKKGNLCQLRITSAKIASLDVRNVFSPYH